MRISDWSSDVCSSDLPGLNQTVCALRFLYGVTLGHSEIPERIPYAREPRKLPVVLSADEVVRFLEAVPGLKRSEERRVGKECDSPCRFRWLPTHAKKKTTP